MVGLVVVGQALQAVYPAALQSAPLAVYTDPLALTFCLGVLAGWAEMTRPSWHAMPHPMLASLTVLTLCFAAMVLCGVSGNLSPLWQVIEAAACLLAVLACTTTAGAKTSVTTRWLERAGDASFSTYLFHGHIIGPAIGLCRHLPEAIRPWVAIALSIVLANLVGYGIFLAVERPITDVLRRRFSPGRPAAISVAA